MSAPAAWYRKRYRTNPEHRAKVIAATKAYAEKHARDPEYRRLCVLAKAIYDYRERIDSGLKRLAKQEAKLIEMVKERDELKAKRRAARHKGAL